MNTPKTFNRIWERGVIIEPLKKSHKNKEKTYWRTKISCKRRDSEREDIIPVVLPEKVKNANDFKVGDFVTIYGLLRSIYSTTAKSKFRKYVYAFSMEPADVENTKNLVVLEGTIAKPPVFRTTPRGKEITDLQINTGRDINACVCWAANAHKVKDLPVGQKVRLRGSVQSRNYHKKKGNEVIVFSTIEVSVYFIETVDAKEEKEEVKISSPES